MNENQEKLTELFQDLVKINSIIATELIQLVENSSRQIRGEIPGACIKARTPPGAERCHLWMDTK